MVARPEIIVRTRQIVTQEISTKPYVGFEHLTNLPDGWEYDIKRWSSIFDLRLPTLPRLSNPSSQGISEEDYFLCGVGSVGLDDLRIYNLKEVSQDNERIWAPYLNHGTYFRYKNDYFLYSDESRIQYLSSSSNRNGRNYIELDKTPSITTPISACSFKRNPSTRVPTYHKRVYQRDKFSGNYSGGEQLETVSAIGKITWSNVNTNKKEFIVDYTIDGITRLFFNNNYIERHGIIPSTYDDLGACESLGISSGSAYQIFYLKYFPVIANNSFHLYVENNGTFEEWTRINTWWELISETLLYPNNKVFFLDKDFGIVYFGSASLGGVPRIGSEIFVTYNETLRIEYEELNKSTKILAENADTNPVSQSISQGFVCITHQLLEPASITLSIDKDSILNTSNPTEYGPIVIGSDYGLLKASVKNINGVVLPNVEVGFTMVPTIGYLQASTEAISTTNSSGDAYSLYQPSNSGEDLGFYSIIARDCTNPYYPSYREVIVTVADAGLENKESEIYLYQILKDDVILGYKTLDSFLSQIYQEQTPSWVIDAATYAQWKSEMIQTWELSEWEEPVQNQFISGRKVVTYQINNVDNVDPTAINPVTGELGAVVPVRPVLVEKITDISNDYYGYWRLIYSAGAVPDCGTNETVGGYWVASSRLVKLQAHCWSPYYNKYIYSNTITIRVSLPPYLLGEYLNSSGQKIPFGWKIKSDTDNVASGLNGATFITINPHHGPYPIIDLVENTGETGEWASAPFRTLGFQFALAANWAASTSYSVGDYVLSTADHMYQCTTAGTSGSSEPTWNTVTGFTTTDNSVVWTRV